MGILIQCVSIHTLIEVSRDDGINAVLNLVLILGFNMVGCPNKQTSNQYCKD